MLLAWAGDEEPASASRILAEVPNALPAAPDPDALLDRVRTLIGGPTDLLSVELQVLDAHVVG